ncbi:FAD-dependent oxidoreductase [Sphingobium tyrosinilyticum]|uniref:FAD-dependent oxidoreductase n=1 Tax=Sphingobium tyrosinilyticum TaxID=2715436 RepID=A0ABV9F4A9_9SPHN
MAQFDEEFDFVVVGSGGGSMCAALVMRQVGKSVLILEKTDLVGGTTAKSGGVMWIPNNPFMEQEGIEDSPEKALEYLEATAGQSQDAPGTSRERRAAYVTQARRMVDFLIAQGIKLTRAPYWPDYYDERPGGSAAGRTVLAEPFNLNELGRWKRKLRPNFIPVVAAPEEMGAVMSARTRRRFGIAIAKLLLRIGKERLTGRNIVGNGAALQGRMLQAALKAKVDIRTKSPVKDLVVENGAVKGVVVDKHGREYRIGARLGVLVNAGGFAQNQAMRDKYAPGTSVKYTAAAPGDTGEMIETMIRLGAAFGQMSERVGLQASLVPGNENLDGNGIDLKKISGQGSVSAPHAIIVDQTGVRYMNEAGSYMAFCRNQLIRNHTVPAVPSWWIFDQWHFDRYPLFGIAGMGARPKRWFSSGLVKKADTIEGLAALINVDPATLRATIDRFNLGAREGRDPDFHRGERAYDNWLGDPTQEGSKTLGPIDTAPFYAVPMYPGDVGTYGGVVTDVNARVLREDGTPIPGLYATGTSTASVMGTAYPGAGSSVGPSFVWGYVAAKHAADADNLLVAA